MPAARDELAEEALTCGRFIEMKRLRVERGGEALDLRLIDGQSARPERLTGGEIVEVELRHGNRARGAPQASRQAFTARRRCSLSSIMPVSLRLYFLA